MNKHVRVVTFGEIMLRLKSPAFERFFQSPALEATFGGGEANVSVSLANYGMDTAYVTVLPNNDIGNACIRELRGFGVDVSNIVRKEGRMGIYYLESGAVQRPSKVIYDRAGSAISEAKPGDIDWDQVFDGVEWFHITGHYPGYFRRRRGTFPGGREAGQGHGTACLLRPELPQEPVEVWQNRRSGNDGTGQVCGYRYRQ